jgi:hypothetical protein
MAALAALLARRCGASGLVLTAWLVLAAIAGGSLSRTLLKHDAATSATPAAVADFAVPSDVRALQGTSGVDDIATERDGTTTLSGWIFDERTRAAGDAMYLDIEGTTRIAGTYGEPRPDIAEAFRAPAAANVGFHVFVERGRLTPGAHRFRIGIRSGTTRYESVRRYVLTIHP